MADIDLQRKEQSGLGWLWALLALLVLVLLAWWLWPDDDDDDFDLDETTIVEPYEQPVEPIRTGLAAIVANPAQWIGQTFPDMRVEVGDEMTDRGFFIESDGVELMAVVIDQPREQFIDINTGQTLMITGGTLRGPDYIGSITGDPIEADTESLLRNQQIFLVVDEANLEIVDGMAAIDTDGNQEISEAEYRVYMANSGVFDRWDANRDGFIDQSEYDRIGFSNDPGYSSLDGDGDGFLDSDEFHAGVWTIYDDDDDGLWDDDEWGDADDDEFFDIF